METEIKKINDLERRLSEFENNYSIFFQHLHSGADSRKVRYLDLSEKKLWVHHTIYGTDAATAANYGVFFIAPVGCAVTVFKEVHQTAGSDAGAVTLDLEKLTGTTAPDSGTSMLASTLSLKATANSVQTATLSNTISNRALTAGDRLCLKDSGTLTAVANVTVLVELQLT